MKANNQPIKALLIEDNPGDARLIQELLAEDGHDFTLVRSDRLATGLERLNSEQFDVLLLDLGLPDSQGLDTFTRAQTQAPDIPIVLLTGLNDKQTSLTAVRGGAQDYLTKGQLIPGLLSRALRYAIERKQTEADLKQANQTLQQSNHDLVILNETGALLTATLNPLQVYRALYEKAIYPLLQVPIFMVALFDPETQIISCEFAITDGEERDLRLFPPMPLGEGPMSKTIRTGRLCIEDFEVIQSSLEERGRLVKIGDERSPKSSLYIPLISGNKTIGVMNVQSYETGAFAEVNLNLLTTIASQAAVTLANAELFAAAQQELGQRQRVEAAQRLQSAALEASANAIMITDSEGTILSVNPAFTRLTGYTAEESVGQTPRLLKSAKQDQNFSRHLWQAIREGKVWQGQLITQRKDGTHYTDKQTITPMRDTEGKISHFIAIHEDVSDQVKAEEEIRQRNRELTLLNRIIATATSALTPEAVLEIACRELALAFDLPQAAAALLDQTGARLKVVAEYLSEGRPASLGAEISLVNNTASHYVLEQKSPLIVTDAQNHPQMTAVHELMRQRGVVSILILPLILRGQALGTIGLDAIERREFTAAEVTLAISAATAVSQVLTNNQLLQELQERNLELSRLYRASGTLLSAASPDPQRLTQIIVETVLAEFEQSNCSLVLVEPNSRRLNRVAIAGPFADDIRDTELTLDGPGLVAAAIRSGQILNVPEVTSHPNYLPGWQANRSELTIPLLIGNHVIGAIDLQSSEPAAFGPNDERLMSTFAERAALALLNARLFAEARGQAKEMEALAAISAAIGKAKTQTEMLPIILEHVLDLLSAAGTALALYEPATNEMAIKLAYGDLSQITGLRLPADQGITGQAISSESDGAAEAFQVFQPDWAGDSHIAASVPLVASEEIIGALWLARKKDINQSEQQLLTAIADIAANAIQRANLYERTLQHAAELKQRVSERTAELSAANAELVRAARTKDEFLANMSHELRTPLSSILLRGELLQMGTYGLLSERQVGSLQVIEESAKHLLALINDILDLAKMGAGKITLEPQTTSVQSVCESSLRLVKEMAHQKQIELLLNVGEEAVTLQADERRLKQVLVNLLSNAVKFTPEGGQVGLEVVADTGQKTMRFTVWDTGIGITPTDISRLFQPFEQLEGGLARKFEGTGLGLSLVKRLAEMHQGSVTVESEVGQGSRFAVTLPWQPDDRITGIPKAGESAAAGDTRPIPLAGAKAPDGSDDHPATLLLAEDNELAADGLVEYLSAAGYRVIVARTGGEAVDQAREEKPDLILMDIQMPGMDGLEATRRIRADAELAAIPIIALTALVMPGDRERFIEAGMNAYLSKPIHLQDLDEAIQGQLLQSRTKDVSDQ